MIRKTVLAIAAVAALGAVALAPTAASAKHFGFHHHHFHGPHFGIGFYGADVVEDDCYYVKKLTRHGYKLIQVCS